MGHGWMGQIRLAVDKWRALADVVDFFLHGSFRSRVVGDAACHADGTCDKNESWVSAGSSAFVIDAEFYLSGG